MNGPYDPYPDFSPLAAGCVVELIFGALRRIRTADLSLRRGPLYPTELPGQTYNGLY